MVLHLAAIITSCVSITSCGVTPARLPIGSLLIMLPSMFVITFSMSSSCPRYMRPTHDDYCFAPLLHVSMMAQFPLRATLSFSQSTNSQKYSPIAQLENIYIFHPVFRLIMIHIRSSLYNYSGKIICLLYTQRLLMMSIVYMYYITPGFLSNSNLTLLASTLAFRILVGPIPMYILCYSFNCCSIGYNPHYYNVLWVFMIVYYRILIDKECFDV